MTRCLNEKELQRLADGELKEAKRSRAAEHVKGCEVCAKELERLQRVGALVSGAIKKETESHDLTGLWERVRAGIASPKPKPSVWELALSLLWKPAVRVAYAAAVVLLVGFFAVRFLLLGPGESLAIRQAQVNSVSSYNPQVTVSVFIPYEDKSAVVWISGLDATKEN